jgi:hypothetical protein
MTLILQIAAGVVLGGIVLGGLWLVATSVIIAMERHW